MDISSILNALFVAKVVISVSQHTSITLIEVRTSADSATTVTAAFLYRISLERHS